jgi:hypothetical protein
MGTKVMEPDHVAQEDDTVVVTASFQFSGIAYGGLSIQSHRMCKPMSRKSL